MLAKKVEEDIISVRKQPILAIKSRSSGVLMVSFQRGVIVQHLEINGVSPQKPLLGPADTTVMLLVSTSLSLKKEKTCK